MSEKIMPEISLLSKENLIDELKLSLGKPPENIDRDEYYQEKQKLFEDLLRKNLQCAMIIYIENIAIGYTEFFPKPLARKLGIIHNSVEDASKCLVISALKVIDKYTNENLEDYLLKQLLEYAKEKNYTKIEVGAYPDKQKWQPISFYKKNDFRLAKKQGKGQRKVYILEKYLY